MTQRNLRRRLDEGWLDGAEADCWAIKCGTHPIRVWPEFFTDLNVPHTWPPNICGDCNSPRRKRQGTWLPCAQGC